ncbi:MAG TPA: hypothetical protein VNW68_00300 [Candidatus Limnocylindria bacterium]|jgi:hypothetical protein|nr:hypothetical protein [Candidatus Limnocylindria bacterium]
MSEPINVTPPEERGEFRRRFFHERDEGPEWLAWTWASRGRGFPWLGVLLVLIGLGLLIQYLFPTVGVGTLVLLAIGLAFLAGWLFGGSWFSMIPGALLVALAVARLIEELGLYVGPGVTALSLAGGFLFIWLVAQTANRRFGWAAWAAAIFGLIGIVQISGRLTGVPELGAFWPIVIIVVGIVLLWSARRR